MNMFERWALAQAQSHVRDRKWLGVTGEAWACMSGPATAVVDGKKVCLHNGEWFWESNGESIPWGSREGEWLSAVIRDEQRQLAAKRRLEGFAKRVEVLGGER